jgi:L-fuculose-phosphate aldolase
MWITPSRIPRYSMQASDLVKVSIATGRWIGHKKPSVEVAMHRQVYLACPSVNAVIHTHSPYTIAVSISTDFKHVIEEAKIVVGKPAIIPNSPSGSTRLATAVSEAFSRGYRAVVVKNHGVIAAGQDLYEARAIVESLEEWAKIMTLTKIFGGAREFLDD